MLVDVPRLLTALNIGGALKRRGEIWAPCPYPSHKDREPSWSIVNNPRSPDHGLNYCFGCGAGGSVLELVTVSAGLHGYSEAVRWIEERALSLECSAPTNVKLVINKEMRGELALPTGLRGGDLSAWVTPARRYVSRRGIDDAQTKRWGIRYAVEGELAGRIVFPIYDITGRLLAYTARSFLGEQPRYLTSRRHSGNALLGAIFGEVHWLPPARRSGAAVVVCEGAFNSLACERAGAAYIAALGGSRLDPIQVSKLSRFGEIIIATDSDSAGNKVAGALLAALSRWCSVKRVELPKNKDPDDLWAENPDGLRRSLWG